MDVFKVDQWMTRQVITAAKDTKAVEAAALMREHNIGCLIVADDNEPIGIVTERDLVRKVLAKRKDPEQTNVEDIMTLNIITAELGMEIKEVSTKMVQFNIKKVPIVQERKIQGIITTSDIVKILSKFNKLYDAKEIIELEIT